MDSPGRTGIAPIAGASEVDYEKLIGLFTASHSSDLYDRHVGVVDRVCRVSSAGFVCPEKEDDFSLDLGEVYHPMAGHKNSRNELRTWSSGYFPDRYFLVSRPNLALCMDTTPQGSFKVTGALCVLPFKTANLSQQVVSVARTTQIVGLLDGLFV
eukprot:1189888-Prorocentrum_minimum.AAC.5